MKGLALLSLMLITATTASLQAQITYGAAGGGCTDISSVTAATLQPSACTPGAAACSQSVLSQCISTVDEFPLPALINEQYDATPCSTEATGYEVFVAGACQPGNQLYACNSTTLTATTYADASCQGAVTSQASVAVRACRAEIVGASKQVCTPGVSSSTSTGAPTTVMPTQMDATSAPTQAGATASPTPAPTPAPITSSSGGTVAPTTSVSGGTLAPTTAAPTMEARNSANALAVGIALWLLVCIFL